MPKMDLRLCFLCVVMGCTVLLSTAANNDVIISLSQGQQLRGRKTTTASSDVFSFLGIRYALPPTGTRRFKPPEPASEWSGVRDALLRGSTCPQISNAGTILGSEDCLYLNVFSPDVNSSLPVMVYIHGGGYYAGSAPSGASLARKGIVVVTINYRLGALGFATTADDVMPGNYAMLDQVLALKWIQTNIRAFGGNPNQVTIAGESAGAHSVSFHILSPLSKGLFRRAILESGSALGSSALDRPGKRIHVEDYTRRVAFYIGCNQTTSSEILQCFRNVDLTRLFQASSRAEVDFGTTLLPEPRVETTFGFLPDYPKTLLDNGNFSNVDTLRGFNSGEWCFVVDDPENDGITRQEFRDYFKNFFWKSSFVNDAEFARIVEEAYLGNQTAPLAIRASLINAMVDITFGAAALVELTKTVEVPNTTTRHFFYEFDRRANGTTSTPDWCGVGHADELQFVFYDETTTNWFTSTDISVADDVQTMWTNFIKVGDPTPISTLFALRARARGTSNLPQWVSYTPSTPMMMKIDVQSSLVRYPRPAVIPLYERLLELMHMEVLVQNTPIIG